MALTLKIKIIQSNYNKILKSLVPVASLRDFWSVLLKRGNKNVQSEHSSFLSTNLRTPMFLRLCNCVLSQELGLHKPNLSIPLTPLMAKLSLLAMEQGAPLPPLATTTSLPRPSPFKTSQERSTQRTEEEGELSRHALYVCSHQDMTLLLLLNEEVSRDPERIHALWEQSISSLGELESHLAHCLEHWPASGTGAVHCESYSYVCVTPNWGTEQRGGAWPSARLELLTHMHHQFISRPNLVETIVRTSDSIVYGCQSCGGAGQVFYQQPCSEGGVAGLPAPSDLMGFVSLKAKRRLERDHGIVLF